jgi:hypothetical protein
MNTITDKTRVSVALVLTLLGGMFWLTTVYAEVRNSSNKIQELQTGQHRKEEQVLEILQRLAVIQEKLERIERTVGR